MLLGAPVSDDDGTWGEVYWRALVEAWPDFLLVIDTSGKILFKNRVVPAGEIVGRYIWEFASGDGEYPDAEPERAGEEVPGGGGSGGFAGEGGHAGGGDAGAAGGPVGATGG